MQFDYAIDGGEVFGANVRTDAAGAIVGPTGVGWIAEGPRGLAGLERGLVFSALELWVGVLLAWRQKPLG